MKNKSLSFTSNTWKYPGSVEVEGTTGDLPINATDPNIIVNVKPESTMSISEGFKIDHRLLNTDWLEPILSNIKEFSALQENWDNYGATPVKDKTYLNSKEIITGIPQKLINKMYDVYPNPHGTISMDWENDNGELVSIEIGIKNMTYFAKFNGTNLIGEDRVRINDNEVMSKIVSLLYRLFT